MAGMDFQLGAVDEGGTYAAGGTPTRFYEYESESIEETEGRTEGDPLRVGSSVVRYDRFTPYFAGAAGSVQMVALTKGLGFWLKHMLGGIATTGPVETTVYTHTGTEGDLKNKSFALQMNRPFLPTGTNQPFLYKGGKVTEFTLSNSVDGNLLLDLAMDFAQVDTASALASASYPTGMETFTWAGGIVTIGGSAYDIDEIGVTWNNGLDVDRRQIRQNTDKKEPTASRRSGTFSIKADFDSMTQRNRAHATTRSAALAAITAIWKGPTILGTTLYPQVAVTIPAGRFDAWKGATEGTDGIKQELSGAIRWDGTNSPITVAYSTADVTP